MSEKSTIIIVLLAMLIVIISNQELIEKFVCPKKYSKQRCSARFVDQCREKKKECLWTRRKPVGYVAIPSEMLVSSSTSTSSSTQKKQDQYLPFESTEYVAPPMCRLDEEGWTQPDNKKRSEINQERQQLQQQYNDIYQPQHLDQLESEITQNQPQPSLLEIYQCRKK